MMNTELAEKLVEQSTNGEAMGIAGDTDQLSTALCDALESLSPMLLGMVLNEAVSVGKKLSNSDDSADNLASRFLAIGMSEIIETLTQRAEEVVADAE